MSDSANDFIKIPRMATVEWLQQLGSYQLISRCTSYDLFNRQQVKVCVYGKVLDENYSQILFANPDLDLETVFLIDCVQKRIKIDREAIKHLRKLKVIEGKSPNIFLSASVSENIGEQSQYVKIRHLMTSIIEILL